jgi:hypothetical protein
MRYAATVALAAALGASVASGRAHAAELELAGYLGLTLPFYEQTFPIDLRPPERPIQGIQIQQIAPLSLNAKGGPAFAGGVTVYFGPVGIEGRYDSADADLTADPPVYSLRLSSPFPNFSTTLEPAPTEVTLAALTPLSLNLKLRTTGTVRFSVSGGVSYLPEFQLAVRQPLNLRVGGIGLPPGLDLGTVTAEAVSRPDDPSEEGRLGANGGLGLGIELSEHAALVVDARVFYFPEQVLEWRVTQTAGAVTLPDALLQSLEQQLEPVRFNPAYFHLQGGLAFSF